MKIRLFLVVLLLVPTLAAAEPKVARVLFDEGHGQRFRIGGNGDLDLSSLAAEVEKAGARVAAVAGIDAASLADAAALVVSGPFLPFSPAETEAILAFLDRGGRLAVMLHVGPPAAGLLAPLGVYHSNGVVRESEGAIEAQPLDFHVRDLAPNPLFAGLDRFAVFGAWALDADDQAAVIARTGPQAWVDLDRDGARSAADAVGAFGLAVAGRRGQGGFVVFGDDAVFQNRYLREHNRALGVRLARWLAGAKP